MQAVIEKMISFTEYFLTYRKKRRFIKNERNKNLHPVADWLGAFFWAAAVVLILNQYLFQAYVIPSASMENTLLIKDRLFVNKYIYGPEILPGIGKLSSKVKPGKTDVVIFENPDYRSRGALFDLSQRLIFMLTLSMVDIDKDESGNPAHHFLIKRSVVQDGDTAKFKNGELYIRPRGESDFIHEVEYKKKHGLEYSILRNIDSAQYREFDKYKRENVYYNTVSYGESPVGAVTDLGDAKFKEILANKYLSQVSPSNVENYYKEYIYNSSGQYIPKGWLLPLGDNRDRSYDGRYFGPIRKSEVLGKASFKFWPINRVGTVR